MIKKLLAAAATATLMATPAVAAPSRPAGALPIVSADFQSVARAGISKKKSNDAVGSLLIPLLAGLAITVLVIVVVSQSDG